MCITNTRFHHVNTDFSRTNYGVISELLRRDLGETTKLNPPGYLFVLCINQLHNGNYIINRDFPIVIFIEIAFLL